jgi:hypothetical protein
MLYKLNTRLSSNSENAQNTFADKIANTFLCFPHIMLRLSKSSVHYSFSSLLPPPLPRSPSSPVQSDHLSFVSPPKKDILYQASNANELSTSSLFLIS